MKNAALLNYDTDLDSVQLEPLDERSRFLRRLIFRAIENGGRGHIGPALSLVEIIRVLYDDFLRHDPAKPHWRERDRFILSKGHGCLALYAVLADRGFSRSRTRSLLHTVRFSADIRNGRRRACTSARPWLPSPRHGFGSPHDWTRQQGLRPDGDARSTRVGLGGRGCADKHHLST